MLFYWNVISENPTLYGGTDTYTWFGYISYLLHYGYIKESFGIAYPQGFVMFISSCLLLLISPNFEMTYLFLKYGPLAFVSFYTIVFAFVIKRIFKKNHLVLVGMIILLSSNYLNFRFLPFNPSNLACLIFLISFEIIISRWPSYLLGFFITLIYLLNPIIAFYYYIVLFLFFVFNFFFEKQKFKQYLTQIFFMISVSIILLIPYLFFIYYLKDVDPLSFVTEHAIGRFSELNLSITSLDSVKWFLKIKENLFNPYYEWYPEEPVWYKKDYKYNEIIFSIFFPCAILGLFVPLKTLNDKSKTQLINFSKCVVVIVFITFFVPAFVNTFFLKKILPPLFLFRMLECYCVPIIILECFFFNFLINRVPVYLKEIYYKIQKNQSRRSRKVLTLKNYKRILISILILSCFTNYEINQERTNNEYNWFKYHYDSDDMEIIQFIREEISKEHQIALHDLSSTWLGNYLYELFWDYDYSLFDFSSKNSYNESKVFFIENNINYFLIYIPEIFNNQLDYFLLNNKGFSKIFENQKYILFKIVGDLDTYNSGYYKATWNFFDEEIGAKNYKISWIDYLSNIGCSYSSIFSDIGNHKKALGLVNCNNGSYCVNYNYLGANDQTSYIKKSGTIEFWFQTCDSNQESGIILRRGNNKMVQIRNLNQKLEYYNGSCYLTAYSGILNNTWYHLRIDFECSDENYLNLFPGRFNLYLNDSMLLNNNQFSVLDLKVSGLQLYSKQNSTNFITYFDAFGYSWEQNYVLGDNQQTIWL